MPLTNPKRSRFFEVYSHSTGLEVSAASKTTTDHNNAMERQGRIQLRFFKLTPKSKPDEVTQIRFICEPDEAYNLGLIIHQVVASLTPSKEKLSPHKFSSEEGEIVTTLSVEKWERGGKGGFALTVARGKDFISVPVPLIKVQFLAEFLRAFSVEQCWIERSEKRFPND